MKIYTKKGDLGQTYLFGGGPFDKDDLRIQSYGEIDELNSVLGVARSFLNRKDFDYALQRIQEDLFTIGSELSSMNPKQEIKDSFLKEETIHFLETQIDNYDKELAPLKNFILPGGHPAASFFHLARTVCRRSERNLVLLKKNSETKAEVKSEVRPILLKYINRLSDYLFTLARIVNHREAIEDIKWQGLKV